VTHERGGCPSSDIGNNGTHENADSEAAAVRLRFRCWTGPTADVVNRMVVGCQPVDNQSDSRVRVASDAFAGISSSTAMLSDAALPLTSQHLAYPLVPTLNPLSFLTAGSPTLAREHTSISRPSSLESSAHQHVGAMSSVPHPQGSRMQYNIAVADHRVATPRGMRVFVQYIVEVTVWPVAIASDTLTSDTCSWQVMRRFSQFTELHHELSARCSIALHDCGARLPSKFRFPSSMEAEGAERMPLLDRYLKQLASSDELRQSEQLRHFLAATTPARRSQWEVATA